jgi:GT2 family glycosyltransferase
MNHFMEKWPKVAVVILHWNNYPDTKECLLSLRKIDYPNYQVILIDNGSTDGSAEKLKREFPDCHFILHQKNEGFAKGSNAGFRYATRNHFDYILSLNNDTTVHQNFLTELVQKAEKMPTFGIFSPKILNYYHPEILDSTGHTFRLGTLVDRGHGKVDRGQFDRKTRIIGACAACALYRVAMLKDIGLFDEVYGTQYEDAELSWRAHRRGWKAKFVPLSIVFHKRGATKRKDAQIYYQLEGPRHLENVVRTVKRHGSVAHKLFFALYLLKTIIYKGVKEKFKVFSNPYTEALRQLLRRQ